MKLKRLKYTDRSKFKEGYMWLYQYVPSWIIGEVHRVTVADIDPIQYLQFNLVAELD